MNDNIIITQNNDAFVQPEQPASVREQAPVLIQENILQDGGIAATIEVGSTTTLTEGEPAYVRNIGDEKHAVLQFGIPKGNTGTAGRNGVDGEAATIQVGSVETVDSSSSANVVNVGTENAAVLNFSIPRGEQGIQGEQGYSPVAYVQQIQGGARIHIADSQTETDVDVMDGQDGAAGQAATITVGSTTTGAAGTNASVVNSGTSSDAILDFVIPRGADGSDGSDGQDGFSPVATVSQTSTGATISITDAQGTTTANITNGVDGTDGTDGQAATITVGSTTTGAAGTNASVVNSGTSSAAVLDFVIPKGDTGSVGYITASDISGNMNISSSGNIIQSLTLTQGKWRVFAQYRLAVSSMGANTTRDFYTGFLLSTSISGTGLIEIRSNITGDTSGTGRCEMFYSSPEINVASTQVVSSYIKYSGTGSAILYKDPGVYLYALKVN